MEKLVSEIQVNRQTILQVNTQGKSPTLNHPQEPPTREQFKIIQQDRQDRSAVLAGGSVGVGFIREREEVIGDELEPKLGAGIAERAPAPPTPEGYPLPKNDSSQTHAMTQSLDELRGLRDRVLREDEHSQAGLLLAQLTLIFERIDCGIPSGREAFVAILRAAQLPEPTPEAVEA